VVLEAPTAHLRTSLERGKPGKTPEPDSGSPRPGGGPPAMPSMPGPSGSHFGTRITPHEGGHAFEAGIVVPAIPHTRQPRVDVKWDVSNPMPGIPSLPLGGPGARAPMCRSREGATAPRRLACR
jgi:hypothetical protein